MGSIVLASASAQAWNVHQLLMPSILEGITADPAFADFLKRETNFPCELQADLYPTLAAQMQLNPDVHLSNSSFCGKTETFAEFLNSHFIDEPDEGIDQNLPDSDDPQHERRWMGGATGITSQGFRHMYFGGWNPFHPLATFQVPIHAIGQAPIRAELMGDAAQARLAGANMPHPEWGVRLLAWSMHYIQDLAQPFHAAQIPSLRMLPLSSPVQVPPRKAFSNFVAETTRTISNYHWAFENYVELRLREGAPELTHCLKDPTTEANLEISPRADAEFIARAVAKASIQLAPEVGAACVEFFGTHLKDPEVSLTKDIGTPDYAAMAHDAALAVPRARLEKVACHALANAALGSRALINWAKAPN